MHSSDILNDTISIESFASHYFNVISACEKHRINRLEMGVLCLLIKTQQNPAADFFCSILPIFLNLIWSLSSDEKRRFPMLLLLILRSI